MINHLFIFERELPTVSIIRHGNESIYPHFDGVSFQMKKASAVRAEDISHADSVILIRPNSSLSTAIARKAASAGKYVMVMCDDDLLNLPEGSPDIPARRKSLIRCLSYADVLSSPSPYIAEKYLEYTKGKKAFVSNTIVKGEDPEEVKMLIAKVLVCDDIALNYTGSMDMDQKQLDQKIYCTYSNPAFKKSVENVSKDVIADILETDGFLRLKKKISKSVPKSEKEEFTKNQNAQRESAKNVKGSEGESSPPISSRKPAEDGTSTPPDTLTLPSLFDSFIFIIAARVALSSEFIFPSAFAINDAQRYINVAYL